MSRASKTETNALKVGKKIFKTSENPGDYIPSSLLPFCYFHTENRITKFCQCTECTLPLCRECEPIHLEEHAKNYSRPDIQDYLTVRESTILEIEKRISALQHVREVIIQGAERNRQMLVEERARVQSIIQEHFRMLLESVGDGQSTKTAADSLGEKLEKIRRGSIKALIQYCSGENEEEVAFNEPQRLEIVRNDQGLLAWLNSTVVLADNRAGSAGNIVSQANLTNQTNLTHQGSFPNPTHPNPHTHQSYPTTPSNSNYAYDFLPQEQGQPKFHHPQQVSTHVPILPRPLAENFTSTQPNIPQFNQTQPVIYQQKPEARYDSSQRPGSVRRESVPSTVRVENAKENAPRSESPKMPAVQVWKSKNVLRNSCEAGSPIRELNKMQENQHARTLEGFNQPRSQEKFNQTFGSEISRRPTSAIGSRTNSQIAIGEGQNHNPMIHQRNPPLQYAPQQPRPLVNVSAENFHNTQSQKVIQVPFTHPNLYPNERVAAPPQLNFAPLAKDGNKILTPEELQLMIVNKRPPVGVEVKASYEHKPSSFALAAAQERSNNAISYTANGAHLDSKPLSPPKDFWKAESYFDNGHSGDYNHQTQENGYRINVIEPPRFDSNSAPGMQLRMEDLVPKNAF